jgi:membrane protein required for colicin V production
VLNWADYIIIGLVALSAFIGLIRGFVREALSILAWVVALAVAFYFAPLAAGYLEPYITTPSLRQGAAFAGLFTATLLLAAMVNFLLAKLVDKTGIKGTDRFLGLLFGIARGALVVALLVLAASLTPFPNDPWWGESRLLPYFEDMAVWLTGFLPEDMADSFSFEAIPPAADSPPPAPVPGEPAAPPPAEPQPAPEASRT